MKSLPYDYEPPMTSKRPRKWPAVTPEMHEEIKRLYRIKSGHSGEVSAFARKHGLPRWKISRYAQRMGWSAKQGKYPEWAPQELRILEKHSKHCPEIVRSQLKKRGFRRSLNSIVLKRKRMRFLQNLDGQSATSLAMCLGEDVHFVLDAIKNGLLVATRRELNRTPQQGGNPFLIKDSAVKDFIVNNVHMIDLRKVDKYWFVDILAG